MTNYVVEWGLAKRAFSDEYLNLKQKWPVSTHLGGLLSVQQTVLVLVVRAKNAIHVAAQVQYSHGREAKFK